MTLMSSPTTYTGTLFMRTGVDSTSVESGRISWESTKREKSVLVHDFKALLFHHPSFRLSLQYYYKYGNRFLKTWLQSRSYEIGNATRKGRGKEPLHGNVCDAVSNAPK